MRSIHRAVVGQLSASGGRDGLHVVLVMVALLLMTSAASLVAADGQTENPKRPTSKPNIVFFLIDDLGYADCGFNGCQDIKTPNIDRLAKAGTVLESLYVQPVCSPTRSALMTGRYATHTGVYTIVRPHAEWGLPLNERTLANALKQAGYETAITGKWHLGEFQPQYRPTSRGFDHQYGHYFGAIDYFTHMRDKSHDWYRDDKELREEGYSTELVAREACRLITEKNKAKPLFLYVPFNGVHAPLQVPERYLAPYENLKGGRRSLAGMLSAVDEAIGKIVATLESTGQRDNTLIVFSADNGGPNPRALSDNGVLRAGKGTLYEGGLRASAFINWPGQIPAGARNKEPLHTVDWFPTLVKLAGGSLDQPLPLDGRDIWPTLTQGAKSPHEALLLVQSPTRAAVRMGDWKLMLNASEVDSESVTETENPKAATKVDNIELYNLANDLSEAKNLATQERERVAAMRAKLNEFLKDAVAPGNATKTVTPTRKKKQK